LTGKYQLKYHGRDPKVVVKDITMPTALVTGSNRGIGIELVRQLAEQGWSVIATCRKPEAADKLQEFAAKAPGRIEILPLDASNHGSIKALVAKLKGRPIDLLMCNAGIAGPKPPVTTGKEGERIQDYGDDTWFEVLRTNLLGPVRIAGYLADNVAASERKLIGFVTSRMANIEENNNGAFYMYRASKAGLNTAIKNLSLELGKSGVTCVGLHPGWVRTDFAPTGPVEPSASAGGLLKVMLGASAADNGRFITYTGERVAW
jgi:NAD(P)-dependent dehydrogenase (short-subunit alcohol dehydrogenase family)